MDVSINFAHALKRIGSDSRVAQIVERIEIIVGDMRQQHVAQFEPIGKLAIAKTPNYVAG